jgi:hypothetical protein
MPCKASELASADSGRGPALLSKGPEVDAVTSHCHCRQQTPVRLLFEYALLPLHNLTSPLLLMRVRGQTRLVFMGKNDMWQLHRPLAHPQIGLILPLPHWVVSKHFSRLCRTSDRPWRGWGGVDRRPAPRGGKNFTSNHPPGWLGGVGGGPRRKYRRCGKTFRCVLTPPP